MSIYIGTLLTINQEAAPPVEAAVVPALPTTFNVLRRRAPFLRQDLAHAPRLVGLWTLNEQEGNAIDLSPYRNHATAYGDPTHSTLINNRLYGVTFDGTDDYFEVDDPEILDFAPDEQFSVLAVVSPSLSANDGIVVSKWGGPGTGWWLMVQGDNNLQFRMDGGFGTLNASIGAGGPGLVADGEPSLVCATYDGSRSASGVRLYSNGALYPTAVTTNTLAGDMSNSAALRIGARDDVVPLHFLGAISTVALFKRVLTLTDIRRYAAAGGFI